MKLLTPTKRQRLFNYLKKLFPHDAYRFHPDSEEVVRIVCPFCSGGRNREETFCINTNTGQIRCWRATCKWAGNETTLVSEIQHVTTGRAYRLIYGSYDHTPEEIKTDLELLKNMMESESRQILSDEKEEFDVWMEDVTPLSESGMRDKIEKWISSRGYDVDKFVEQHNIFVPQQIKKMYGRVLFEVTSAGSRTYQAYMYDTEFLARTDLPKTLNPPGAVLSRVLYNYDNIVNSNKLFITEGIFDCARMMDRGLPAVCSFGTNIQPAQISLLAKTSASEIIIAYDHGTGWYFDVDKWKKGPMIKAAELLAQMLPGKKISYMKIQTPGGDPDSISEKELLYCFKNRIDVTQLDELAQLRNSLIGLRGEDD